MDTQQTLVSKDFNAHELVVERTFDAPRSLVWDGWTKAENIAKWWGPKGWPVGHCTLDLRVGGKWQYSLRGPEGDEHWAMAIYKEIVAPERLVYTSFFTDENGSQLNDLPETALATIIFDELGEKTKITARFQYATESDLKAILAMGMAEGFTQTLDNLAQYLEQGI